MKTPAVLLPALCASVGAFTAPRHSATVRAATSLNAVPPMIIGGMIRKMREEQAKKKMPMASPDEQVGQAPGLRVGTDAWRWPPVWPYDQEFFTPKEDIPQKPSEQANAVATMLSGTPTLPGAADAVGESKVDPLDPLEYWGVEKADVRTELDPEASQKLTEHYAFYLKDGMSVLELGAAEESYLPKGFKPSRHVGVGANMKMMDQNPSLTDKLVVDLNKVVEDRDVDNDEFRALATEPFDVVIMANTIDYLTHPREVLRSAWYLIKPGGTMFISFANKQAFANKFQRAQTKMWRDFNDDQHMWIAGSMFQFSAGEGWNNLLGFDISPESAKDALETGPLDFMKSGKNNNYYIVQATKGVQEDTIDAANPEKSLKSKMWMLPVIEDRDKQLVAPRLARFYNKTKADDVKQSINDNVSKLPTVYEVLTKMDQFAFTFQMQSQLAADLVANPLFVGNDEQISALKQGLGLRTPTPEFWQPIGELTAAMNINDKINLLAYLVPRFGTGDEEQEAALQRFVAGLSPTFGLIKSKCPDMDESDVQLLGTELLCSEVLVPGRSTPFEFAAWVSALSSDELQEMLSSRKAVSESAQAELREYKAQLAAEEKKREELRRKYEEQVKKAREERSMAFNPATGKFEEIKREEKEKAGTK